MNDYLNNLVARTLGQIPAIQPRLASRFEPAESTAAFPSDATGIFQRRTDEPVEVEGELDASGHDPNGGPAISRRRRSPSDQTAGTEESLGAAGPDRADTISHLPAAVPIKTSAPQPQPDPLSRSISPVQAEREGAPLLPRQPLPTLAGADRADAKIFVDPAMATPPSETLIRAEDGRGDSSRRRETEDRRDRDTEKAAGTAAEGSSRMQPLQSVDWLSPVSPAAVAAPPSTPPPSQIEREPVIKVTIGRLEVRAVMSAPPAAPVAAAEQTPRIQAMPLNEYLRRRNDGEL